MQSAVIQTHQDRPLRQQVDRLLNAGGWLAECGGQFGGGGSGPPGALEGGG